MRHVPEEELHAYLDQALSRSQCVEIETHLARCGRCRDVRDDAAALRDRTTALLASLTPRPLILPPPMAELMSRRPIPVGPRLSVRSRRLGLLAAGVLGAVGAGWLARSVTLPISADMPVPMATALPAAPVSTPITTVEHIAEAPESQTESQPRRLELAHKPPQPTAPSEPIAPAPELTLASAVAPAGEGTGEGSVGASTVPVVPPVANSAGFDRLWRSVEWEEALVLAGGSLPFINGLPVLGVLLQPGQPGERPAVIVSQQHPSGEILRSIEGPVSKVTEFLQQPAEPGLNASEPARTTPDYIESRGVTRRILRALAVTGRIRADSLTVMARAAALR
jgi:hypothetical protein